MPALKHDTTPLWVPVAEVARMLSLDTRTVRKLAAEGKLRSRSDLGKSLLIAYADVVGPLEGSSPGSWCLGDDVSPGSSCLADSDAGVAA
jgi:excisionase family DNA binding protein